MDSKGNKSKNVQVKEVMLKKNVENRQPIDFTPNENKIKNSLGNLMVLCKTCHKNIHKN